MPHILVLEPDALLASSLSHYLTRNGYTVSVHSDPQLAVLSADEQKPDIVVTELQLAGRSGVEFLYEFRSYPDWQAIPIVVFSNLHNEELDAYHEVFDELSINKYLHKPTTHLDQLLGTLQACLVPISI